jgi:hypothetical protein
MTLDNFLPPNGIRGWIGLVFMAALWLNCTIGILCLMEVRYHALVALSCDLMS